MQAGIHTYKQTQRRQPDILRQAINNTCRQADKQTGRETDTRVDRRTDLVSQRQIQTVRGGKPTGRHKPTVGQIYRGADGLPD